MATRNERVVLSLDDSGFTSGMAKAAAATAALDKQLDSLDGTNVSTTSSTKGLGDSTSTTAKKTKEYTIATALAEETTARFKKQLRDQAKEMLNATQNVGLADDAVRKLGDGSNDSGRQIDRLSGRLSLLAQAASVLGPALVPLGAAAVPAVAGLTAGVGALAGAVGVGALAFTGLGDGLEALNAYQLKPTAENMKALQLEMRNLGPAGENFVTFLDSVGPQFKSLQFAARDGLFPGVEEGIRNILPLLPQVRDVINNIAEAMGGLASDAGASLAGPEFEDFFAYLENEAAPILTEFGKTLGNFAQGFANLLVGLAPATSDFSGGLLEMSESFAEWSRSLETNDGFQSFLDYVREAGPKAVDFLGSLVVAIAEIAKAAAPVGDVVLPILTTLLDLLGGLAASPLGPVLVGLAAGASVVSRAMAVAELATNKFISAADHLNGTARNGSAAMTAMARAGAALAVLSVAGIAIDGIRDAAAGAAPEVEKLTAALIAANPDQFAEEFGGTLSQALDALDPGVIDTIAGSLNNLGEKGGSIGTGLVNGLGALIGLAPAMNETAVTSKEASEAFGALDAALAGLVASAGPERAKEAFADLAASQGLNSEQTDALLSQLPQYDAALQDVANKAALAADGTRKFSNAMGTSAEAARAEAQALRESVNAMREKTAALNGAFNAETQYRQALKDAQAQAKKNEAGIKGNTDAALANRGALGQLAGAWNNQSNAVKNNVARFRESRAAFIETAVAMGVPTAAAEKLADRLLEIPKSVVSKVSLAGAPEAIALAARVKAGIDSIKSKTVYLTTVAVNGGARPMGGQAQGSANALGGLYSSVPGDVANRHQPEIARGGAVPRVWAEAETGGEAYIPLANDGRRPRAKAIAAETVRMLGGATHFAEGGFTAYAGNHVINNPNSQLYGLNQAFMSIAEFGDRINNLSSHQLADLSRDAEDLSKKNLARLSRAFDKASESAEKESQRADNRAAAELAALKALRDASKQFADAVASNFRTDVFSGGIDLTNAPGFTEAMNAYINSHPELQGGGVSGDDRRQAYLDSLTPAQLSALQAQASAGALVNDTRNAQTFEQILQQLQAMGLRGGAFNDLAASGNLAQAQAYASLGPDFIKSLVDDFKNRDAALKNLGSYVGNVRFGADIHEQLQETRRASRIAEEQRDELREIKQSGRRVEHRLAALEKRAASNPKETGQAVGRAINGAAANAARSA